MRCALFAKAVCMKGHRARVTRLDPLYTPSGARMLPGLISAAPELEAGEPPEARVWAAIVSEGCDGFVRSITLLHTPSAIYHAFCSR